MSDIKQPSSVSLSPDLWAKVFAHLQDGAETSGDTFPTNGAERSERKQKQAELHRLKLVCKQFKGIHASHSELVRRLYLGPEFSIRALPSLLAWLQQRSSSLEVFQSLCSETLLDTVLAALASNELSIKMVDAYFFSALSVSLLAKVKSLEACTLGWPGKQQLDVAALGLLSRLSRLTLIGHFKGLHHLVGLTLLECDSANVVGVQELSSTLQRLVVTDSLLDGIHAQGLSAFTALTKLVLSDTCLVGSGGLYLDHSLTVVPANIGLLTQLHTLVLSEFGYQLEVSNLAWIAELTCLQDLTISFYNSQKVIEYALLLTKLTRLYMSGLNDEDDIIPQTMNIDCEWHKLQALQEVSICRFSLLLGRGIASLLQLQHLRYMSFEGSFVQSKSDHEAFTVVSGQLAKLQPEVRLVVDKSMLKCL